MSLLTATRMSGLKWRSKILIACLFLAATTASAQIIYQENFDAYAVNTSPPGWTILFSGYGSQYQVVGVTNNPPSPPNSYKLEGACNFASTSYHMLAVFPNKVRLELRVKVDNPLSTCLPYQDAIMGFFNYPNHPTTMYGVGFAAGMINGAMPFTYDTWYDIRVELDKTAKTYSAWANGQPIFTNQSYSGSDPNSVFLTAHNKGHTRVWYDDIQVTELTSPPQDQVGPKVTSAQVTTLLTNFLTSGGFWLNVKATDSETGNSNVTDLEYIFGTNQGQGSPAYRSFNPKLPSVEQLVLITGMPLDATSVTLRAKDEAGNWGLPVVLEVSLLRSGFDPSVNGFRFTNPPGQCTKYTFFGQTIGGFDCCTGTAMTAVDYFLSGKSADVQLSEVLSTIQKNHESGILKWLKQAFEIIFGDPNPQVEYSWIRQQITNTPKKPALIWLMGGSQGKVSHVIVAAALFELSSQELGNQRVIAVYDPNQANFTKTMSIPETGSFVFEPYDYTRMKYLPYETHFLGFVAKCPVDISVSDPMGRNVDSVSSEIPDASYIRLYANNPPDTAIAICINEGIAGGRYAIRVMPTDEASSESLFSLFVHSNDSVFSLAEGMHVGDIPASGFSFFPGPWASLSGNVHDGLSHELIGVTMDVYDELGVLYRSLQSDEAGHFGIDSIPNGNYTISVVTPLGYQADQETKELTVNHVPVTVNFILTPTNITPNPRTRAYWANQLQKAIQNRPQDFTVARFAQFTGLINSHFNQNPLNPVDFYLVPQPASRQDSLNVLKQLLNLAQSSVDDPFLKRLGKGDLMALMLNVVSGKIHQMQSISHDGISVSQAITYCDMLLNDEIEPPNDGGPGCGQQFFRYLRADFILTLINLGLSVPNGMIPADVIEIAYKQRNEAQLPSSFALQQNVPNPFNPSTEISFSLPKACEVSLEVFNVMGQKVAGLVNEFKAAGNHTVKWNGTDDVGQTVASGVYLYRLKAGDFVETKKMILMK